jgi:hypothetical protein
MILMRMHGYSNPVAILDDLILSVRPHLAAIIFHGDNCVVQYGADWINTRRRSVLYGRLPTIFAHNLTAWTGFNSVLFG